MNVAAPITSRQFDTRVDHTLSAKQSMFGRFSWKNMDSVSPNTLSLPDDTSKNNSRSLVVSHVYTITAVHRKRVPVRLLDQQLPDRIRFRRQEAHGRYRPEDPR